MVVQVKQDVAQVLDSAQTMNSFEMSTGEQRLT